MLAAAAMNFKRMMNIWKDNLLALVFHLLQLLSQLAAATKISMSYQLLTF
jgi:hypothetical protein